VPGICTRLINDGVNSSSKSPVINNPCHCRTCIYQTRSTGPHSHLRTCNGSGIANVLVCEIVRLFTAPVSTLNYLLLPKDIGRWEWGPVLRVWYIHVLQWQGLFITGLFTTAVDAVIYQTGCKCCTIDLGPNWVSQFPGRNSYLRALRNQCATRTCPSRHRHRLCLLLLILLGGAARVCPGDFKT